MFSYFCKIKILIPIRKLLKILAWVSGLIVLLLFGAAIAAQTAAVQTMLARKAVKVFGDRINAEVRLENISISPMMGVTMKGIAVIDPGAWEPSDGRHAQDTIFSASYLAATFSPRMLFSKNGISLRQVKVSGAMFAIATEPCVNERGRTGNLRRVFDKGKKKKQKKDLSVRIGRVEIDGMEFRMLNYCSSKKPGAEDAIDWKNLLVSDIYLKGHNLSIAGGTVSGQADELSFREKSGFTARQVSGKVRVGGGRTVIDGLHIDDGISDIHMSRFMMEYENQKSFSSFLSDVSISADIRPSIADMRSIAYFAPSLKGADFRAEVEGFFRGPVSAFSVRDLRFGNAADGMKGTLNGSVTGLPDISGLRMDIRLADASFTLPELERFIKGFAPSASPGLPDLQLGRLGSVDAAVSGRLGDMRVNLKAAAGSSRLNAAVTVRGIAGKNSGISIDGTVGADRLRLGAIIGSPALGNASFSVSAGVSLDGNGIKARIDTLNVERITALGHEFRGIGARGKYDGDGLEARVVCADSALTMNMEAFMERDGGNTYRLHADILNADLDAIGLIRGRGSSLSLTADAEAAGTRGKDLAGKLFLSGIRLKDTGGIRSAGDMTVSVRDDGNGENIDIDSDFLKGGYSGSADAASFIREFAGLSVMNEMPSLFGKEKTEWSGNEAGLNILVNDTDDVFSFFIPGLYIADSTSLRAGINGQGHTHADLRSGRIALRDRYLKDLRIDLDNREHMLNLVVNSGEFAFSPFLTGDNRIMMLAHDDSFGVSLSYDNDDDPELSNKGELFLQGVFGRDEQGILETELSLLPSNIYINSSAWSLNPSSVSVRDGRIDISSLEFTNEGQRISAEGTWSGSSRDSLSVEFTEFDLSSLNPLLKNGPEIEGFATGGIRVTGSDGGGMPEIGLNISVADCGIAGLPAGDLTVSGSWDKEEEGFGISLRNLYEGRSTIAAAAMFKPKGKELNGRVGLSEFDLGYAAPVLRSVFREVGGRLSGSIRLKGSLDRPDISSNGLSLDEGRLRVDFTGVEYGISGPLHLDNDGAWFDNDRLSDSYGSTGYINGGISWDRFRDMAFDTRISFTDMELLDTGPSDGQAFYGNVFGSGTLDIRGPLNSLRLEAVAGTTKAGSFHVDMSSSSASSGSSDILTFRNPEARKTTDRYELMTARLETEEKGESDLGISLRIDVDPDTQAFVEIDKSGGNVLTGRGRGELEIDVRPSRDIFGINGKYELSDGNYHLDVMGIAQKDFAIQEGSSIRFAGDIMDSELDIEAVYRTKASVGTLIADTTSVARRNVECGISISEKIRNPRIGFSISVPDLDPSTQAMVDNALNTEDKVQKQFLSLLLSGGFLPDDNSGIVNNSGMFNTTISEIMAGQLNNILQKLDIPVDLGLDFQSGSNGRSVYDVAISTQLFNNRVIVNGTIGNRKYSNSATSNEFVGDLDIEIKIDRKGALRFNLFSHSADQYTSYLDASQRNGLGLTYQREFDSVGAFLHDLFVPADRKSVTGAAKEENRKRKYIVIGDAVRKDGGTDRTDKGKKL